jgi:hypothetical protein
MTTAFPARPGSDDAAAYYATYINQVPEGDIRDILATQLSETTTLLGSIDESRAGHRYAPDKWTIKEVVSHINDTERVFAFRTFWFGRAFDQPMPSFDQNLAIQFAQADARSLAAHVDEFRAIRSATLALVRSLPEAAWSRRGAASGHPVPVCALAYITAGHVAHHVRLLRERYL